MYILHWIMPFVQLIISLIATCHHVICTYEYNSLYSCVQCHVAVDKIMNRFLRVICTEKHDMWLLYILYVYRMQQDHAQSQYQIIIIIILVSNQMDNQPSADNQTWRSSAFVTCRNCIFWWVDCLIAKLKSLYNRVFQNAQKSKDL